MPGRISEDAFAVEFGRPETKHMRCRVGDTLDHDVEVHLLRDGCIRPGRQTMARSELEPESGGCVVGRHDNESVACVGDRMVQECGVEPCEPSRVGTVENDVVQASEHAFNGLRRRLQLAASGVRSCPVMPSLTGHERALHAAIEWVVHPRRQPACVKIGL